MITTTIPLTLSLSVALGIYMLAGVVAMVRLGDDAPALINEFERSRGLAYLAGIVAFAVGVALILAHNIWTDPLAGIVSFVGWVAAIEGLLLIAWPDPLWRLSRRLVRPSAGKAFALTLGVIGAVLLLLGLTGTAG